VDDGDLVAVVVLGVLEGVLADTSRSDFSDQLDTLDDSVDDFVLDAGVFTFLQQKFSVSFQFRFKFLYFSPCSHEL
jgi:hypothetical protein